MLSRLYSAGDLSLDLEMPRDQSIGAERITERSGPKSQMSGDGESDKMSEAG